VGDGYAETIIRVSAGGVKSGLKANFACGGARKGCTAGAARHSGGTGDSRLAVVRDILHTDSGRRLHSCRCDGPPRDAYGFSEALRYKDTTYISIIQYETLGYLTNCRQSKAHFPSLQILLVTNCFQTFFVGIIVF
jgi:hypothetical protein